LLKHFLVLTLLTSAASAPFPDWGDSVLLTVAITSLLLGVALNSFVLTALPLIALAAEGLLTYFGAPEEVRALAAGALVAAEALYLFR